MAETTIEWTATRLPDGTVLPGYTFNPWIGCTAVSPACDNCYAETQNSFRKWNTDGWGAHASRKRTSAAYWKKPLAWNREAERTGIRRKVFCASLADVFDNHKSIDPQWRLDLFELISETPYLDWLLLTKRPQNIKKMLPIGWEDGVLQSPFENVWLGTTVENQEEADRRIPHLLSVPAKVRFLSIEPLLGPVDLMQWLRGCHECAAECGFRSGETQPPTNEKCETCGWVGENAGEFCPDCGAQNFIWVCPDCNGNVVQHHPDTPVLDWVITGGESGKNARPAAPDWFRSIRDQCAAADVPFFFKQMSQADTKSFKDFDRFPVDLQIREIPA